MPPSCDAHPPDSAKCVGSYSLAPSEEGASRLCFFASLVPPGVGGALSIGFSGN